MKTASGKFEIKSTPLPIDETTKSIGANRLSFEKKFSGSLNATSLVTMMGIFDPKINSGAYVAIEKITGELDSIQGSFCIAHCSLMDNGKSSQKLSVIPGSGTDQLKNLSGEMIINIVDGQHYYDFKYELN